MVVERGSTGKYLKEEAGKEKGEEVVKEYLKSSCILKREERWQSLIGLASIG